MIHRLIHVLGLGFAIACGEPRAPAPPGAVPVTRPRIVAHRGASHDAPENTLAAFRRAWELGVESVELDVHVTRDHQPVVIHDPTTLRVAGVDRRVADQTLAEVRALDAGSWKHAAFRGERIPTLAEVLDALPAGRTLFLELKSDAATIPAVVKTVAAHDPRPRGGKLALQAYDPDTLAALSDALPAVPAYWTVNPPVEHAGTPDERVLPYPRDLIQLALKRGFAGLALYHVAVESDFLDAARAAGLSIDVWTINDAAALAAWQARDVRWIETDRPDLAR